MNLAYKIVLDKTKDIWNWLDSSRKPFFCGFSWQSQLSGSSLFFFNKIVDLPSYCDSKEIEKYLDVLYKRNKVFFNKQIEKISNKFSGQFLPSCKWIEETTKNLCFLIHITYISQHFRVVHMTQIMATSSLIFIEIMV